MSMNQESIFGADEHNEYNVPAIFTIFGGTGDLASKKIIPSLWHLRQEHRLPERIAVIAFSFEQLSDAEFKEKVRRAVRMSIKSEVSEAQFEEFYKMFEYQVGTFENQESFVALAERISKIETAWGMCPNKLFYLAVPPSTFEVIFKHLASVKLNLPCGGDLGWSRILIEKPFGHDAASARDLQAMLAQYFKEEQIYRIDHYLFKEIVQGIQNFRFSNNLLEEVWSGSNIERIDLRLYETIGVEQRGSFYDKIGALRDVGENHLLMMLAAITMEYPIGMDTDAIRTNRTGILHTLAPWTEDTVKRHTYRAQYDGYKKITGVNPESTTETYFALKTELLHPRWAGVPIHMEAGKRLAEPRKEIVITLKQPRITLLPEADVHTPNTITFRLEPNDEIVIEFWTKRPGYDQILEQRSISFFLYEKKNKVQYVEEYAKVINAAIVGKQSFFTAEKEIEALWKFIDPITSAWSKNLVPLDTYVPDTTPNPALLERPAEMMVTNIRKGTIGFIGLGKMGANLARSLRKKGWGVAGFNQETEATKALEQEGIIGTYSLAEFVQALPPPRTVWLMVPHQAVDAVLGDLAPLLGKGDTIIDGGNSPYKESIRRHGELEKLGVNFLDAGVSGGPEGALGGACIMVGGERVLYDRYEHLFADLTVPNGYVYAGRAGAGHFVKMVHNGIEYGMMQAIAEGFAVLKKSPLNIEVAETADLYGHGSVIESRLISWLAKAYKQFGVTLDAEECCSPTVDASGEGQWTVDEAHELGVPVPIIEGSLEFRKQSHLDPSYAGRILSALRHQFGGHNAAQKK